MTDRQLGFGIIGCGMIANFHAQALAAVPGARLVAATDVAEGLRREFAGKYGITAEESVEALLARPDVDVVCVCTPSGLHAGQAIQAARAGRHVVLEKPMALNLADADAVIEAGIKNNVRVAVISQLRFAPAVMRVRGAVEEGLLGRLVAGDITMKYYRSQQYYDSGGWRGTWAMDGGGALMNQGIHGVDLLLHIMGPVASVSAYARTLARRIEVEDTCMAALEFQSGALGVLQATTSVYPGQPRLLSVHGERGTIALEEDCIRTWAIEGQDVPADVVIGRTASGSANAPGAMAVDGHVRQLGDMVAAIGENRAPLVDGIEGRKAVQLIMAVYESARTGKQVKLSTR